MNHVNLGKPYRPAHLKEEAKRTATKGKDGAYHSNVPVYYHSGSCTGNPCTCRGAPALREKTSVPVA